jgi:hypothetical protein
MAMGMHGGEFTANAWQNKGVYTGRSNGKNM